MSLYCPPPGFHPRKRLSGNMSPPPLPVVTGVGFGTSRYYGKRCSRFKG
jgi:hypothetical protein